MGLNVWADTDTKIPKRPIDDPLIDAAPDMLEALEKCANDSVFLHCSSKTWKAVMDAIAKAKGQA